MNSHLLHCSNLSVSFGGVRALAQVNISVKKGEILGIFGPNGAGKTTLFNAISGHVPLQSGSILLKGKPIAGVRPDRIYQMGLARTFQLPELVESQTVEANVVLGAHFCQDRKLWGALKFADDTWEIANQAMDMFGLTAIRSKRTGLTSLYERKLLMMASAYASKPDILLVDEPAGGLTDSEIDSIMDHMKKIASTGVTILIIEHVMRVLMDMSTRVVVLNQGRVFAEGNPRSIQDNREVRRLYFGETT